MVKLKKNLIFASFLLLLILVSGCSGKKDVKKSIEDLRTGTDGVIASFLPYNPPDTVHVEENKDNEFDIILELKNRGAYPQPDEGTAPAGKVFLSGFDSNIIEVKPKENSNELGRRALEGKSLINLNGGSDLATFTGKVDYAKLNVEKYDLVLLATACYEYETIAGPSVCIDPDPYSTVKEKKICEVNDLTLSNQGAPVAVTKVEEEAFDQKTQFKITIKNIGGGDVIKHSIAEQGSICNPFGEKKLGRDDVDKVLLEGVRIADQPLQCRPFAIEPIESTSGFIRLTNGEGSIVCELRKDTSTTYKDSKTTFTTPLNIHLKYFYRTNSQRSLRIKKETNK